MKNYKIVLVEDDEVTIRMYGLQFEAAGLKLLSASTGSEGFALIKKEKPDLVLLDIKLPDMEGFEVLKKIKADAQTKATKVIIFSNTQKTGNSEKALRLGAEEFVMKTKVLPNEMLVKVKGYLV